jgi:drug/metabolite transporter (DMT)-like permease
LLALALALSSSACWGVSDFLGGLQSRRIALLRVLLVSQAVGLGGLGVVLALRGVGPPSGIRMLPAVGGGLAGMLALAAFYRGLAIGTMSIVAPISGTGAAVPVIVGVATGERPGGLQVAGICAAVVGVVLASREHGPAAAPEKTGAARASVALALVAALGFGSFFVGLRSSARHDVLWALFAARAASVLVLACAAALRRDALGLQHGRLIVLAVIGALDLGANGLYALATRHGLLSVVAVASSLYPLATVVLARLVLGERVRRVQEVGIVAALAGVAMIAAG